MEKLVIAWTPERGECDWLVLDRNGNRVGTVSRGTTLSQVCSAAAGREIVWLVPGVHALSVSASLPVKGRDKVQKALPYALEERFAEDPESLFFALATTSPGGPVQAVALDREWLGSAVERLREEGLDVRSALPDYLALPREPDQWTVLADAGMLHVRHGERSGFSVEADPGWQLLKARLETLPEEERPPRVRFLRGREPHGTIPELEGLEADPEPVTEGLLGVVPEGLAAPAPLELLQGPFGRQQSWLPWLRPWIPAAAALGAIALLALAGFVANWVQAAQTNAHLENAIRNRFHQVLPAARWQGESMARAEVTQRLQQSAAGARTSGLMSILGAVAKAGTDQVSIQSFSYQGGTLQLQVHAANVSALDDLRAAVSGHGVSASVQSANQTKSGVNGALRVSAGGGAG